MPGSADGRGSRKKYLLNRVVPREEYVLFAKTNLSLRSKSDYHSEFNLYQRWFPLQDVMFFTTVLTALSGAVLASATTTNATCDPNTLNTTSFNYVNDIANQTVHEIAVKFNRGVCDIGRANLS